MSNTSESSASRFIQVVLLAVTIGILIGFFAYFITRWDQQNKAKLRTLSEKIVEAVAVGEAKRHEAAMEQGALNAGLAQQEAKKRQGQTIREDTARTKAFVECVNTLGLQKCRLIEQHGAARCANKSETQQMSVCLSNMLSVSWGTDYMEEAGVGSIGQISVESVGSVE